MLPVVKEVTAHEGQGGNDPGQSSVGRRLSMSNAGDDGYEQGQSSQVEEEMLMVMNQGRVVR